MRGDRSPYAVLGLRPGASRSAVDEAYRRLMKQHHPDLPGGDAREAAEINRAYAFLRDYTPAATLPAALESDRRRDKRRRVQGRITGLAMLLLAAGLLLFLPAPAERESGRENSVRERVGLQAAGLHPMPSVDLRSLPDDDAIATAVAVARQFGSYGKFGEATEFSRSCEQDLKTFSSPSLLDHCVAFDTAVARMGGAGVNARFRAEDMAARHVGAALRISDDPVLAEERVASVRAKAEGLLTAMKKP